jgi:PhnB protein
MRVMIIRRADESTEAGVRPGKELFRAMEEYNGEMAKAGVLRDGVGLKPSAKGARVKFAAGKPTVTDGPFAETKELIAGFTMIEVKSMDEAIAWVKRWPREDGDVELEIRPLFEPEDFADLLK